MIGRRNLTDVMPAEVELSWRLTTSGQADRVDIHSSEVCGHCVNWVQEYGSHKHRCAEFKRRAYGKHGAALLSRTRACLAFEQKG
jgi:hypothetical protein